MPNIKRLLTVALLSSITFGSSTIKYAPKSVANANDPLGQNRYKLAVAQTEFAFDLFSVLKSQPGNFSFAPYGIATNLTAISAGASGETQKQFHQVLRLPGDLVGDDLHDAVSGLNKDLRTRTVDQDKKIHLRIANALWLKSTAHQKFRDLLATRYDAQVLNANFADKQNTQYAINDWAKEHTAGKISKLSSPDLFSDQTEFLLANALYFAADWATQFDAAKTSAKPFHQTASNVHDVPMMQQEAASLGFGRGDGYTAVRLPYVNQQFAMLMIMPDDGKFEEFQAKFDANKLSAIESGIFQSRVNLTMPKFSFSGHADFSEHLQKLGLTEAFSTSANFSNITDSQLSLETIAQEVLVEVDEKGTKAAAVTTSSGFNCSSEGPTFDVVVDRPFFFVIQDLKTRTILFMGRIINPS